MKSADRERKQHPFPDCTKIVLPAWCALCEVHGWRIEIVTPETRGLMPNPAPFYCDKCTAEIKKKRDVKL